MKLGLDPNREGVSAGESLRPPTRKGDIYLRVAFLLAIFSSTIFLCMVLFPQAFANSGGGIATVLGVVLGLVGVSIIYLLVLSFRIVKRDQDWCEREAKKGRPDAQFEVGQMCKNRGDDKEAVRWYRSAAKQGHVAAQMRLGQMYHLGRGIRQNAVEAKRWLRLAAWQGHAGAKRELARLFPTASYTLPPQARDALISGRYRDLGNGTVLDTQTDLQWMRCPLGSNGMVEEALVVEKGYGGQRCTRG